MNLKSLLWTDFLLGFSTGAAGILLHRALEAWLGIPARAIVVISVVTFLYSLFALLLAKRKRAGERPVKILILANWLWSFVSVLLLAWYYSDASLFGRIYLILQVLAVGGLAYLEGNALNRLKKRV